mmetsp:Transcript_53121/g.158965  ORF Transcript_53121/g.158965 Transcript_53121/m.158965 type:complete len:564 (-) Transcript_53121:585-2276(-)
MFSGEYKAEKTKSLSRVEYINVYAYRHGETSNGVNGKFFFCKDLESWVFAMGNDSKDCEKKWMARSPMTGSYDITTVPPSDWYVRKANTNVFTPADFFSLTSSDCSKVRSEELACNGHGNCEEPKSRRGGICRCNDGWWGLNCQYRYPCPQINHPTDKERFPGLEPTTLKRDANSNGDQDAFSGYVYDRYLRVFEKPVYYRQNVGKQHSLKDLYELLVFTGRRWVVTTNGRLGIQSFGSYLGREKSKYALEAIILEKLTAGSDQADFSWVLFVSEPTDDGAATVQNASPDGVSWFDVRELEGRKFLDFEQMEEVGTSLQCELCRLNYKDCQNGGRCVVHDKVRRMEEEEYDGEEDEKSNKNVFDNGDEEEDNEEGVDEDDTEDDEDDGNESDDEDDAAKNSDDILETNYKPFSEEDWGRCECNETVVHDVGSLCQHEIDENNNCYNIDKVFKSDCVCHGSCTKCGTRGNDGYDCLVCKGSESPRVFFDLGTRAGCCEDSGSRCPKCDASCAFCGSKLNNCVECATGYTPEAYKNADGTFLCTKNLSSLTPAPAPPEMFFAERK